MLISLNELICLLFAAPYLPNFKYAFAPLFEVLLFNKKKNIEITILLVLYISEKPRQNR
jgi:hypothetical protein